MPTLSKEVAQNAELALREINLISSQTDPDMTKMPGQLRGGPAVKMMLEEKNKILTPTATDAVRVTVEGGRRLLGLAKHFYTGERIIKYVGDDNEFRVLEYDSAEINTDIRVVGDPGYFHSAATARAEILEYVETGIFDPVNNPEDKAAVLKALAFGSAHEAISEKLADEENQELEIHAVNSFPEKFVLQTPDGPTLKPLPVQPYDDDAAHIRVLKRWLKSDDGRRADPIARGVNMAHLQMHEQRQQAAIQQQMAMMQAMQGTPGSKGKASQPSPRS